MRRYLTLAIVAFILLSTFGAVAGTAFSGLVGVPFEVSLDGIHLTGRDVSIDNYALLVEYSDPYTGIERTVKLPLDGTIHLSKFNFTYLGAYVGSKNYAYIAVNTSYLLPGDVLNVSGYSISVVAVSSKGPVLKVVDPSGKSYSFSGGGEHKVGNLLIKPAGVYPSVYKGYLSVNSTLSFDGHNITFVEVNVSSDFTSSAVFRADGGEDVSIGEGKTAVVGPFSVSVSKIACRENSTSGCNCCVHYAQVTINYLGVSLDVSVVPDFSFSLKPGQSINVGDYYLLRYDYLFDGAPRVSLHNLCGMEKAKGSLKPLPAGSDLVYRGIVLFTRDVNSETGVATFYGFLDKEELQDLSKLANLLVNYSFGEGVQYAAVRGNVTITNTGTVPVNNVVVELPEVKGVLFLNGREFNVGSIPPGKTVVIPIEAVPLSPGNLTLGRATVRGEVPYDPACCGYTLMSFTSNDAGLEVKPAELNYSVRASVSDLSCTLKLVNVTIENNGPIDVEPLLMARYPRELSVYPEFVGTVNGSTIATRVSLSPGTTASYLLKVHSGVPFNGTLTVSLVNPYNPGEVLSSSQVKVAFGACGGTTVTETATVTQPCNCTGNGTTETITVTSTKTLTSTVTRTKTTTALSTVPYTPLSSKALWAGLGFVLGFVSIITLAWYQARKA